MLASISNFFGYVFGDLQAHFLARLGLAVWPAPSTLAVIVVCTSIVYLFLVFFLQFSRRSFLGHSSMLDLVLMLVLANGVQNAMVAGDNTLLGGLVAALTLFAWDGTLGYLRRHYPRARRFVGGERIKIVENGEPVLRRLKREGLELDELQEALQREKLDRFDQVQDAYLEVDGSITWVPRRDTDVERRTQMKIPPQHYDDFVP